MDQKRAVTGRLVAKYRSTKGRRVRAELLDELVGLTEYNRHYAAWMLRNFGKKRIVRDANGTLVKLVVGRRNKRRPTVRPHKYDQAVKGVPVYLWDCFDQMCGKPLAAILPQMLPLLVKHKKLKKSEAAFKKLLPISPATIDRMLKEERARRRLKGIAYTTPTTALKNSIPIVISSEQCTDEPGHYQIDLVGHDGGNPNGQFVHPHGGGAVFGLDRATQFLE